MFKKMQKLVSLFLLSVFLFILFPLQAEAGTIVYRTTIKLNSDLTTDWDWKSALGKKLQWSTDLLPGSQWHLWNPKPEPPQQEEPAPIPEDDSNQSSEFSAEEKMMLELVNKERQQRGLNPLVMDTELVHLARMKSQDMIEKNYFSHTSPTYGSPFEMMKDYGVAYRYAGENLAGASTVEIAHRSLMNSPGHRANILNANYKKIGIGIISGGPYGKMFTQMFTG